METITQPEKSVLLIDDSELDNFINRTIIRLCDYSKKITHFESPVKALEFLNRAEGDLAKIPELIFLDISMPLMDGFGFLREFEKLAESTRKRSKIVMLTSSISNNDIEKAYKNSHVIKFLNKPLTKEKLFGLRDLN